MGTDVTGKYLITPHVFTHPWGGTIAYWRRLMATGLFNRQTDHPERHLFSDIISTLSLARIYARAAHSTSYIPQAEERAVAEQDKWYILGGDTDGEFAL